MADNVNHEYFYNTGYSSLDPDFGNYAGLRNLNLSAVGSPTSIQTANQLNEVVSRIREGASNVELQPIQAETFEQIPKQHFKEVRALMNLTGVKPSVHAPMIDPAGFGQKGAWEKEEGMKRAENQLFSVIERSHELDPNGNVPIVIHSSAGLPGHEYEPDGKGGFKEKKLILINQESGQMVPIEEERKFYPSNPEDLEKGGTLRNPRKDIKTINATEWDQKITNLAFYNKNAEEVMGNAPLLLGDVINKPLTKDYEKELSKLPDKQKLAYKKLDDAGIFLENVEQQFTSMFDKAYRYGTEEQRKKLTKLSKDFKKTQEHLEKNATIGFPLKKKELMDEAISNLHAITKGPNAPEVYQDVEKFAMDKAATTLGNVAFKSYNKFKEHTPIMAIENMYQGMAFSRAEDMKKLVEKTRNKFVENAVKKGINKNQAEKQAKKFIGVTWDVGHLNMMKKQGFTDKDVIKETERIAPMIKHVHLTDNFGYSDSHLTPGMGNVPTKEILKEMEKAGTLKDARAIVEAGTVAANFKTSPFKLTMEAMGSPIYGMKMAPYWNQAMGTQGAYFGMPHAYLPEKHFSTYGTSFSSLPQELGGQMPGTASRFSGTPNT